MTRWIRNLNFSTKLVVIMVAGLVPVILLSALYLTQKQGEIGHAERELLAAQRYANVEAMLLPVGVHEVESIATLLGQGAPDRLQAPVNELARIMSQHVPYIDSDGPAADEEAAALECGALRLEPHSDRQACQRGGCDSPAHRAAPQDSRVSRLHRRSPRGCCSNPIRTRST